MKSFPKFLGVVGTAVAACTTLLAGGAAQADDDSGRFDRDRFSYYVTLTGASEYMFRGISYTNEDPTINSYVEVDYDTKSLFGTAYIAFWTSNIDYFDTYGPWEQDIYAGFRPVSKVWGHDITWDFAAWYYLYGAKGVGLTGQDLNTGDLAYLELKAAASTTPFTNLSTSLTFYYTPDQSNSNFVATLETWTVEGGVNYTLPNCGIFTPVIGGIVGYTEAPDGSGWFLGDDNYTYWNTGLKLTVEKYFMDFRYWDTTIDDGLADARFVFSAGVNLVP